CSTSRPAATMAMTAEVGPQFSASHGPVPIWSTTTRSSEAWAWEAANRPAAAVRPTTPRPRNAVRRLSVVCSGLVKPGYLRGVWGTWTGEPREPVARHAPAPRGATGAPSGGSTLGQNGPARQAVRDPPLVRRGAHRRRRRPGARCAPRPGPAGGDRRGPTRRLDAVGRRPWPPRCRRAHAGYPGRDVTRRSPPSCAARPRGPAARADGGPGRVGPARPAGARGGARHRAAGAAGRAAGHPPRGPRRRARGRPAAVHPGAAVRPAQRGDRPGAGVPRGERPAARPRGRRLLPGAAGGLGLGAAGAAAPLGPQREPLPEGGGTGMSTLIHLPVFGLVLTLGAYL